MSEKIYVVGDGSGGDFGTVNKATEERQISLKMHMLSKCQDELNGALGELTRRLEPVLFPPDPELTAVQDPRDMGKMRDPSCPLANILQERIDETIKRTQNISDLIHRLAL